MNYDTWLYNESISKTGCVFVAKKKKNIEMKNQKKTKTKENRETS